MANVGAWINKDEAILIVGEVRLEVSANEAEQLMRCIKGAIEVDMFNGMLGD